MAIQQRSDTADAKAVGNTDPATAPNADLETATTAELEAAARKGAARSDPARTADLTAPAGLTHAEMNGASTAELMSRASEQIRTLARAEAELARAELQGKGKQAGIGGGMLGGAGVLGMYLIGILLAAAVAGLAVVWPVWLAALVVAGAVALIAGVLALLGRSRIRRASPLVPAEAMASIKADIAAVRDAFTEGRRS